MAFGPDMGARGWPRLLAAVLLLLLVGPGCLKPLPFDEAAWQRRVRATDPALLYAPHRRPDGTFFNPWLPREHSGWSLLRWWASRNTLPPAAAKDIPTPTVANDGAYLKDPKAPDSLTWVGHATYVLQWSGQVVVVDPLFSDTVALVRSRLVPPAFGPQAIPRGAVVLISHNHYDHLDADSVAALAKREAVFLVPLGLGGLLREMGAQQVRELDWWQEIKLGGSRFVCLPAQHWSRRLGQGYNQSLWCSWLAERGGRRIYFGGDSGYFKGFAEIGRRWPGIQLALLGAGAYLPRWFMHYAHADVPELFQATADLGARFLVPTQWGAFKLGDEPPAWPAQEIRQYMQDNPKWQGRAILMPVGGRLLL
ncbi:MAG: hypothetical protein C4525_01520 [Desulfarculus sp.]|nr:MAG: hypothetical protein C4525_01520 [Desulfarculus sp.]